jgi:ketosteroid isomerase-like protein
MSKEYVVRGVRYAISLPSGSAAQSRSLDERFFLRFPAVFRRLAEWVTRLPPGSRVRRLVLTRLARRVAAAVNRRDFSVLLLAIHPEIEYRPAPEQVPPGMETVVHGHDGYVRVWRQMIDAFEDFHAEPEEILDLGDHLLATTQYKGHGSGSGVPVTIPVFQVFRLRRGLAVWQRDFSDRSEALEAVGLEE